eukprot:CAMPEP_0181242698 /NCGR_PEP_ID=MMETSP1096-20121128/41836_1 /TAXON_ID=156174 ORGANISM="Chrysochromulina ericina, Strain CCMP281" /NCGR_SAMPLE_ID=MMETSP1096 /ASSEMBLY_ACC=CAM_ASM_000453 /LENGTH=153 /DNA_ID=CAMNT_0023338939 /DNA_START=385 /DNA_END=846 /DNA_ORIENTATION=-
MGSTTRFTCNNVLHPPCLSCRCAAAALPLPCRCPAAAAAAAAAAALPLLLHCRCCYTAAAATLPLLLHCPYPSWPHHLVFPFFSSDGTSTSLQPVTPCPSHFCGTSASFTYSGSPGPLVASGTAAAFRSTTTDIGFPSDALTMGPIENATSTK